MNHGTAAAVPARTAAADEHDSQVPTIVDDVGVRVETADEVAAATAALDGATAVVVTTTSPTGVERTRRVVCLTLAGAEATVDRAHARGHRATAVVVRLVPLGAIR
ncbi:hypothetical protein [Kineococcus rhizosphaerae]|uniref:Uncharacterized protein n=1 Tax=Kineococcus rhizosphaerae TaxID=559628 RepID=A0A2T0QLQ1_9ACTN|nr:hypothetical protein [Kineococcus rhizosphaerae]PRY05400.1 hypothetical protein CLV37_13912 [Kineococcus rhizosphaerae]